MSFTLKLVHEGICYQVKFQGSKTKLKVNM